MLYTFYFVVIYCRNIDSNLSQVLHLVFAAARGAVVDELLDLTGAPQQQTGTPANFAYMLASCIANVYF